MDAETIETACETTAELYAELVDAYGFSSEPKAMRVAQQAWAKGDIRMENWSGLKSAFSEPLIISIPQRTEIKMDQK